MNRTISVIVPVYNAADTIDRCVSSIVDQSYDDLQIILVNDGSTDHSLQKCFEWGQRDSRVEILDRPNAGVGAARNAGLEVARGEFLAFVDSDDYIASDMYQIMTESMDRDASDLVFCRYASFGKDGKVEPCVEERLEELTHNKIEVFFDHRNSVMGAVWRLLLKRADVAQVRFDPDLKIAEDLVYVLRCLQRAERVSVLDRYLYFYYYEGVFGKKYYNADYARMHALLGERLSELLSEFGLNALAEAERYSRYCIAVIGAAKYDPDYKAAIKKIRSHAFYREADCKRNYRAYLSVATPKERIKARLIRRKFFGLLKVMLRINDPA